MQNYLSYSEQASWPRSGCLTGCILVRSRSGFLQDMASAEARRDTLRQRGNLTARAIFLTRVVIVGLRATIGAALGLRGRPFRPGLTPAKAWHKVSARAGTCLAESKTAKQVTRTLVEAPSLRSIGQPGIVSNTLSTGPGSMLMCLYDLGISNT